MLSTFTLLHHEDVDYWLEAMSPHELALVRNIRQLSARHTYMGGFKWLPSKFPTLKKLMIYLDTDTYDDMDEEDWDHLVQGHGMAVELIHSDCCNWTVQWASGDLNAKCRMCLELEELEALEAD